jgi:hypothetical protein
MTIRKHQAQWEASNFESVRVTRCRPASETTVNVLESFVQIMVVVAATALPIIGAIWLVAGRGAGRGGFSGTGLF